MYIYVRWEWFLGLGVLPAWNPTIMQGTYMLPRPPKWAGLSIVYICVYLRTLVGIGIYIYIVK